jgi:hypothetical protein
MTAMNTLKWNKIGRDDYRSACGRFHICRLEAADNKYANKGLNADHEREEFAAYILLPRVRSFLAREQNSTI